MSHTPVDLYVHHLETCRLLYRHLFVFSMWTSLQIPGSNMARQISTPISCKLWVSWPHRKSITSAVGQKSIQRKREIQPNFRRCWSWNDSLMNLWSNRWGSCSSQYLSHCFSLISRLGCTTLPETNSSHLEGSQVPRRKQVSSNHPFSGVSC